MKKLTEQVLAYIRFLQLLSLAKLEKKKKKIIVKRMVSVKKISKFAPNSSEIAKLTNLYI